MMSSRNIKNKLNISGLLSKTGTGIRAVLGFVDTEKNAQQLALQLTDAVRNGDFRKIKRLVAHPVDYRDFGSLYGTPLHTVYRLTDGNIALLRFFLDQGLDPETRDHAGYNLLDTAVIEGRLDLCRMLLQRGVRLVATPKGEFSTPIQKAVRYQQVPIIKYFLEFLSANAKTIPVIYDMLRDAVASGNLEFIQIILPYCYQREQLVVEIGRLLHVNDSLEVLQYLLAQGIEINTLDECGVRPISKYIVDNRTDLAMALLAHKPILDDEHLEFSHLLLSAAKHNNLELVKCLLRHEPAHVISDEDKNFRHWILCQCAEDRLSLEVIKVLLDAGADVNARDYKKRTPLMIAARKNNPYYVKLFSKVSADPYLVDAEGKTALIHAVINKSEKCILPLLSITQNVEQRDNKGFDVVVHCAVSGNEWIASALTAKSINLVQTYPQDRSTLMFAAMANNTQMLGFLLSIGARINATDQKQRTALMYACGNGHVEATAYLIEQGAQLTLVDSDGFKAEDLAVNDEVKCLFSNLTPSPWKGEGWDGGQNFPLHRPHSHPVLPPKGEGI